MFNNENSVHVSIQDRMRFAQFEMLYRNVRNRLCKHIEVLTYDFLQTLHEGGAVFVQRYKAMPMQYLCRTVGYGGEIIESSYLVVAGGQHVVVLRDPHEAVERGLSFLMVLEGQQFEPHYGSATDYWQTYIEPVVRDTGNVLPGQDNFVRLGGMLHVKNVLQTNTLRLP